MNAQISVWRRFDDGTIYEYPLESLYLTVFANLGNISYLDTDTLHLSTERSGNVLYYSFFRWVEVGCCVGITIGINGYAFRDISSLYTYISTMLNDVWNGMIRIGSGESEEIFSVLIDNIRVTLSNSLLFPLSPLPPIDYSIPTSYFRGFVFENSELSDIIASINKGVTHVGWPITESKAEKVEDNSEKEAPQASNEPDSATEVKKSPKFKWDTFSWFFSMLCISIFLLGIVSECIRNTNSKSSYDTDPYSTSQRYSDYSDDQETIPLVDQIVQDDDYDSDDESIYNWDDYDTDDDYYLDEDEEEDDSSYWNSY
ncbi:MAG: hypothetical protein PUJ69_02190 [Porphyromonas somerae]|uniref:hypothetical protein n=1 Tax=Porphyromonas somerae TaxID=322095 RepID=UPI0026EFD6A3|nr:hypothetical protein [Porphyromonas somerae]MDD7557466.1 hypothetical protein [Porphyromonas somerae]MDY5815964.1 hypothetical protein [Porphyromonas somerae]